MTLTRDDHRLACLRRLHALGRVAGLAHEDLRHLVGVESLALASADDLLAACRRIDPNTPPWMTTPARRRGPRLASDATDRQRSAIHTLLWRLVALGRVRDADAYLHRLARIRIAELLRGDYLPRRTAARLVRDLMHLADAPERGGGHDA